MLRQHGNTVALFLAVGATTVLAGCLAQMEALNNALAKGNTAVSNFSGGTAAPPMPVMSGPQRQAMRSQLAVAVSDRGLVLAREEAKGTIEKVLVTSACYTGFDLNQYLQQYLDPQPDMGLFSPMVRMNYHPKSQCLTITRLDGWRMLAKNAFVFRAVYVSEASSETASLHYKMVKQADGAWLFR